MTDGIGLREQRITAAGTTDVSWDTLEAGVQLRLLDDGVHAYLTADRSGSTRLVTGDTGALAGSTDYDTYGAVRLPSGTSEACP